MKKMNSAALAAALLLFAGAAWSDDAPSQAPRTDAPKVKIERRRIVVSVIGADLPHLAPGEKPTAELAIAHWDREMSSEWPNHPDLVVLPEVCDTFWGMTAEAKLAYLKERGDKVLDFFRKCAKIHRCYLVYGTYRELPQGGYANCTYLIGRDGEVVGVYDKNYPTVRDIDHVGVRPGEDAPVFDTDFGTLGMIICFDLNFDELLERYAAKRPDVLVFSSYYHGGLMQPYWAYRCRAHFICSGVGNVGSSVISPVGEMIKKSTGYYWKFTTSINTNCAVVHLDFNMDKIQSAINRYGTYITLSDPGDLGAVLLTSERPEVKIDDVLKEFGIERWDDYYQRSVDARERALRPPVQEDGEKNVEGDGENGGKEQ